MSSPIIFSLRILFWLRDKFPNSFFGIRGLPDPGTHIELVCPMSYETANVFKLYSPVYFYYDIWVLPTQNLHALHGFRDKCLSLQSRIHPHHQSFIVHTLQPIKNLNSSRGIYGEPRSEAGVPRVLERCPHFFFGTETLVMNEDRAKSQVSE